MDILGFPRSARGGGRNLPLSSQPLKLEPKKRPSQARSRATFEALVEAGAWVLAERGYARATTNHIALRAGVNVASLYEYFPGKDAIVAQVAERLVHRVMEGVAVGAARVVQRDPNDAMRHWIHWIHDTVAREKRLVAVFLHEVPYTAELPPLKTLRTTVIDFSQQIRRHAGGFVRADFSDATVHLAVNLVTFTILQLVVEPPSDVSRSALLDELARRLDAWIREPLP